MEDVEKNREKKLEKGSNVEDKKKLKKGEKVEEKLEEVCEENN